MAVGAWTDDENDAIVADYFAILKAEETGQGYSKTAHNRSLQERLGRGRGSIEYKHQNISAVLVALGENRIEGYKPAFNFQSSLVDAVARWLAGNPAWLGRGHGIPTDPSPPGVGEDSILWIGPAPTLRNAPPPDELELTLATARRFDVALRDERNRVLGRAGEKRVLEHEQASLRSAGRSDLVDSIVWVSDLEGDGAGFDIRSFEPDGRDRLIEVKTTRGWERTPFHISRNELRAANERRDAWCLFRLHDFGRAPRAFEIRPPLDAHVELTPTSFQASFR